MATKHIDGDDYGYPPGVGSVPAANLRDQLRQLREDYADALRWAESANLELLRAEAELSRVRAEIARLTDGGAG